MNKPFDSKRIINEQWHIHSFNQIIPTFLISPLNKQCSKVLIYIPGLNGNGSMIKFFNYKMFDNCYLFSFDPRAQGNNKNKASRFYKSYVKDIKLIIDTFKIKYPHISDIYLCGESWGSALAFLTYKQYPKDIKGIIGWNMPYNIVDISTETGKEKWKKSFKVFLTFLFSINTYDFSPFVNDLTNNKILIKAISIIKNNKLNNKVVLAAWKSFKKAWKFIIKNQSSNIQYIQSKEDIMFTKQTQKIINKVNNVIILDKGYHILSFDINSANILFDEIEKFIKNN